MIGREERGRLMDEVQSLVDLTKELMRCALSFIAAYERKFWETKIDGMIDSISPQLSPLQQLIENAARESAAEKAKDRSTVVYFPTFDPTLPPSHTFSPSSQLQEEDEEDEEEMRRDEERRRKLQKLQIARELSEITAVTSGNFSSWAKSNDFGVCKMHSVAELTALKWRKKYAQEWDYFNERHLSRIYPKGSRFDSSNYSPVPFWCVGCQAVSLNFQTQDTPMRVNTALFQDNGQCGYVLKPEGVKDFLCPLTDFTRPTFISALSLTIISGDQLPLPNKSFLKKSSSSSVHLVAAVHGFPIDERECKGQIATASNLGRAVWKERFKFPIAFPELAFLVVNVMNRDECIGHFACRVSLLKPGYRKMPLLSKRGDLEPNAGLFCKVVLPRKSAAAKK
mmetsp:Transcript_16326/g.25362  ORF Transcript_16326/g.25362 Transcript_16326/m.25362 type:complete len:396 (-) Transcript_16326:61-1248(-)